MITYHKKPTILRHLKTPKTPGNLCIIFLLKKLVKLAITNINLLFVRKILQ